jgi:germination protein M
LKNIIFICILVALVVGALLLVRDVFQKPPGPERVTAPETVKTVTLYFGSVDGSSLVAESRDIKVTDDPLEDLRRVVEALIGGPTGDGVQTFPREVAVKGVYIADRTAYIDFSKQLVDNFAGGSAGEYLLVASLVQTVCANFQEIDSVCLLVEGKSVDTIGGHMDVSRALNPKDWR